MKTKKYSANIFYMKLSTLISGLVITFITTFPVLASTEEYKCAIKDVLRLSETGNFVTHEWSANYLNRNFTVDKESGKVIETTALKVRLSNFNKDFSPRVFISDTYKSITIFEDINRYALLEINTSVEDARKPFFYHTNIGMILTGTCTSGAP